MHGVDVLAMSGAMAMVIGGWMLTNQRHGVDIPWITERWKHGSIGTRMVLGHLLWFPVGIICLFFAQAPSTIWIGWGLGLASYLGLGWAIPRQPLVAYQRRRREILRLLPSLLNHIRIGVASSEPRMQILEGYVRIPDRRLAPMQAFVADAIQLVEHDRRLPFEAIAIAAQPYQIPSLTSATALLAQSEREGTDPIDALHRLFEMVERDLMALFREEVERKKLLLVGITALSVVSIVIQILYVAVAGSDIGGVLSW